MPRPAVLRKPVRLHLLLEKETVVKLQKLAEGRARPLTEIIRDLAESYANGQVVIKEKPLSNVIARIRALRARIHPTSQKSETIIRHLRERRA